MRNKNGFTLVELLVTISIMSVLLIISFPSINKFISKNNRETYETYREMLRAAGKTYFENLGYIISGCYEIKYSDLINAELISSTSKDVSKSIVYVNTDTDGNAIEYKVNLYDKDNKIILSPEFTDSTCEYEVLEYKDGYGGDRDKTVNKPHLDGYLVPIKYKNGQWVVADINNIKISTFENDYSWYDYPKGYAANAAYMKNVNIYNSYRKNNKFIIGKKVVESDVLNKFVWIPEFEYNDSNKKLKFLKTGVEPHSEYYIPNGFKNLNGNILPGIWVSKSRESKNIDVLLNYGYNYETKMNSHMASTRSDEGNSIKKFISWAGIYNIKSLYGIDDFDYIQLRYKKIAKNCKITYKYSQPTDSIMSNCPSTWEKISGEVPGCYSKTLGKNAVFDYYYHYDASDCIGKNRYIPSLNSKYPASVINSLPDYTCQGCHYKYNSTKTGGTKIDPNCKEKDIWLEARYEFRGDFLYKTSAISFEEEGGYLDVSNPLYDKYLSYDGVDDIEPGKCTGKITKGKYDYIDDKYKVNDGNQLIGYNIPNNYSVTVEIDISDDANIILW